MAENTAHHPEISAAATGAEDQLIAAKQSVFHHLPVESSVHEETTVAITPEQSQAKYQVRCDTKTEPPIGSIGHRATTTTRKDILLNFAMGMDESGTEARSEQQPEMAAPTVPLVASSPIRGFSSPGAYAHGSSGDNENSIPQDAPEEGSPENVHPTIVEEDGAGGTLAEAEPVVLPSGTAEPVHSSEQPKSSPHRMSWLWSLLGFVFMLVVIGTVVTVLLVGKDDDKESSEPPEELVEANATQELYSINPSGDDFWDWDLPFEVPDATRLALEEDFDHSTPISKAFKWTKLDPYLDTYSSHRLLQRFILSLFYYSTHGDGWIHKGDELASVTVELPDFVLSHYLSRGRDGPGRRQLELEEDKAWHQSISTNPSSGGQRKLQPPGGGGTCGGFIPEVGGLKQATLYAKPWLSYNDSECDWFSTAPLVNLTACNSMGEMFALDLELNNLGGTLPPEITLFSSLNILNVWGNNIQFSLFTDIGRLTNLRFLYGRKNALTGEIPSELGLLTNLWQLDINQNSMRGSLPPEFWSLSNIEQIHIGDNQFSGSIHPDIGFLFPKLRTLRLRQNHFTGTLPTSLGLLSDLWAVALWTNEFSGTIPSEVGNLSNLHFLLLQGNKFRGTVPSEIGRIPHMVQLKLTGNPQINGQLPTELGLLNETLYVFDIRGTSITGTIPKRLCSLDCVLFDCSATLCGCNCPCNNSTL